MNQSLCELTWDATMLQSKSWYFARAFTSVSWMGTT